MADVVLELRWPLHWQSEFCRRFGSVPTSCLTRLSCETCGDGIELVSDVSAAHMCLNRVQGVKCVMTANASADRPEHLRDLFLPFRRLDASVMGRGRRPSSALLLSRTLTFTLPLGTKRCTLRIRREAATRAFTLKVVLETCEVP